MRKEFKHEIKVYATKAIHKLGDISREPTHVTENVARIYAEDGDDYLGMWVTGFGFFDVRFPKDTVRNLTEEEKEELTGAKFRISDQPAWTIDVSKNLEDIEYAD